HNSFGSSHTFNLFLAVSPKIFIINATSILLIHEVLFSTSKKSNYPPLVNNVGWLGLLSVTRLGGQRTLGCKGAMIAQLLNLMRHRVQTVENYSTRGPSSKTPDSRRHISLNAMLNVRPTLHYVGTYAGKARYNFTYFCQILLLLSMASTIVLCFDSFELERFDAFEFIVLIPLPTRTIEPQSLCFYVIAASKRKSKFSTEADSKYLILGAFPSRILLFGYNQTTNDI
ncbi:hypothetical protein RGQ29_008423, partial [Quercus rubra]